MFRTGIAVVILLSITVLAQAFEHKVLDNGLEIFVEENHVVPLVNVRITFRAGAVVETPELNGLCHLYEHMLFKGNKKYPDQKLFKGALKKIGVGSWNGGTHIEYVTYYFTIPSKFMDEGVEFWAHAMKTPLLREDELKKERKIVHNEISGDQSEPIYPFRKAIRETLYPDHFYRRDIGGDLSVIDTATVEKLRHIKNNFYVPNNAAIFIAGDVDPDEVFASVEKYYSDWKRGSGFPQLPDHRKLKKDKWVAVATAPTRDIVTVNIMYRGPDIGKDVESSYAADVWTQMINSPDGKFKTALEKEIPQLYGGTRYVSGGYYTQRDGGESYFSFKISAGKGLWGTLKKLDRVLKREITRMTEKGYFSEDEINRAKREISNHVILAKETPSRFMSNLSFWWASTSTDYYVKYLDNIKKTDVQDVTRYINRYMNGKYSVKAIWLNSSDNKKYGITRMAGRMK